MNKLGYILAAIMLIAGAGSTLTSKYMYSMKIDIGGTVTEPNHPAVYTALMFLGEFMCLPSYAGIRAVNNHKHKEKVTAPGKLAFKWIPHTFLFIVPTAFDLVGSQLFSMGNYYSIASVYQVLRNLIVPFVAIFSLILFRDYRKRFDIHHIVGLVCILVGAAGTGLAATFFPDASGDSGATESVDTTNAALGVLFTVLGCLFSAGFFFSEEIGLRRIDAHPFQGVGIEGSWGLIFYAILLPIFNIVTDPFSSANDEGIKPKMADLSLWAKQFTTSGVYVLFHFLNLVSVYGFNVAGMSITKYSNASVRVTIDALRTVVVSIVSLAIGLEKFHKVRTSLQLFFFVVIFFGVITYNRVLVKLPYMRAANKEDAALARAQEKQEQIEVQEENAGIEV